MARGGVRDGSGRKGKWNNSETQVIRVPIALAAKILENARHLDSGNQIKFIKLIQYDDCDDF